MKKALIASTILATLGGAAYAETGVTISGYGRFGLLYDGSASGDTESTTIHTRLRLNIDAKTETDSGVVFGGRIRMQSSNGDSSNEFSAATLSASYEGLSVKVGNVDSALENDSAGLWFGSEIGFVDSSFGDSRRDAAGNLFAFSSKGGIDDRMCILASYTVGEFSVQASYIDPDQSLKDGAQLSPFTESETSLYLSYATDLFVLAAGGVWNAAGEDGSDIYFVGGKYNFSDIAYVGLTYTDEGESLGVDYDKTTVLYGGYTIDAITLKGYVAYNDADYNDSSSAYGIGADYDLGGARVSGSIQRGYDEETYADLGVRFDF